MTPKERAFHLYFSFIRDVIADKDKAKICALNVVDNILDALSSTIILYASDYAYEADDYWIEVKEELNKL
jgi:predicted TIM-barrel fold metal-dependent hydrolase